MLETPRLALAPWLFSDWTQLRPIATDPNVMRYINGGTPWSDPQIQSFVQRQIDLFAERTYCRWKLSLRDSGEMIGFCGVGLWHDLPEIGWWLAQHAWGRGLATEAARCALQDVLDRSDLRRIISVAQPANSASIAVMKKIGLSKEADFVHDGLDLVRYSMLR